MKFRLMANIFLWKEQDLRELILNPLQFTKQTRSHQIHYL
jgi:hypothetical protein